MMKKFTVVMVATAALSLSATVAEAVKPATGGSSTYKDQEVSVSNVGNQPVITVQNLSVSNHINDLNLQPSGNSIQVKLKGDVECGGVLFENYKEKIGTSFREGRLGVGTEQTAYWDVQAGSSSNINKSSHTVTKTLNVPVNAFNGTAHEINAVDVILQKAAQHAGGEADYLRQDRNIYVQIPVRFQAECQKYTRLKIAKETIIEAGGDYLVDTKMINVRIAYKGDADLIGKAKLNAQLGGNLPNQFQVGEQAFKLVSADFMPNIPHYYGKCIPAKNPKIRVNYKMSGDKSGVMDFRIVSGANFYQAYGTYYEELGIMKNPKLAGKNGHFDFHFPLIEILSDPKYSYMAIANNKNHQHQMKLQARYTPQLGQPTAWKDMDVATFRHRCVPQTVAPLGGGGSVSFDNNGGTKPLGKKLSIPSTSKPPRRAN